MAYLVMEYLPGITLRELLKDYKKLTPEQTVDIMDAVLSGLAAAHQAGIVHRDLKPENVLLADDGRIKIGDFGLARAASANTATGQALLGTIAYLSPELVTRGVADARSDIYAVGIMMYEMLTGEQPYMGEAPMQIAYQHANDSVPTPSSKNPTVPAELDELVLWATARDPEERPNDARVMLERLREVEPDIRVVAHGAPHAGHDGDPGCRDADRCAPPPRPPCSAPARSSRPSLATATLAASDDAARTRPPSRRPPIAASAAGTGSSPSCCCSPGSPRAPAGTSAPARARSRPCPRRRPCSPTTPGRCSQAEGFEVVDGERHDPDGRRPARCPARTRPAASRRDGARRSRCSSRSGRGCCPSPTSSACPRPRHAPPSPTSPSPSRPRRSSRPTSPPARSSRVLGADGDPARRGVRRARRRHPRRLRRRGARRHGPARGRGRGGARRRRARGRPGRARVQRRRCRSTT